MNFLFTKYFYPIQDPIIISSKFNFELDNARTPEELELVHKHLSKSLNSPNEVYEHDRHFRIPIYITDETRGMLSVESALYDLQKNYSLHDKYLKIFFQNNKQTDPLKKLAKIWVIARFNDNGESERLKTIAEQNKANGQRGIFLIGEDNPIVENSEKLVNYCYLLSLLLHEDDSYEHGKSFLLNHDISELQIPIVNRWINKSVMFFGMLAYSLEISHKEDEWHSFYHIKGKLLEISKKVNEVIDKSNQDKILYISNLLKVIGNEIQDERYRLVTLVSIIELMLTHNPDNNRFNVEESISKQFRLKSSILIYQNNKSKDINLIKERLKEIYNLRSNISHGNFKSLNDYLRKEVKKANENDVDEVIILERITKDIYIFIKAIIEEYIKDRKLVEFIKEN